MRRTVNARDTSFRSLTWSMPSTSRIDEVM
jgi:hypothetical protein